MNSSSTLNYLKKPFKKFSNLKLSKKSKTTDELPDLSPEARDLFSEDLTLHPSLPNFHGDIEAAVSQYFNKVNDYDYYDDMRDTNDCRFTTFKTPALPKKTLKANAPKPPVLNNPPSVPSTASDHSSKNDNQHLDVKFQLHKIETEIEERKIVETEPNDNDFQALDNPLYLSLNECSTGSQENIDHLYENASAPASDKDDDDDDHIYENVETQFNLYDTVSNPPRPKLPPKPGHNSNQGKGFGTVKKKKKNSFAARDNKSKDHRKLKLSKSQSFSIMTKRQEEKLLVRDGSETSDLGSSGCEDTTSEEDWPLPPVPSECDIVSSDIPFPPPPLELALQQLEDDVRFNEREENFIVDEPASQKSDVELESKSLDSQNEYEGDICDNPKEKQENNYNEEKDNELSVKDDDKLESKIFREEESLRKKLWKSKISTISKGLNAYNEIAEINKNKDLINDSELDLPINENNQMEEAELPSIRHSVVIELKDSAIPLASSSTSNLLDSNHNRKDKLHDSVVISEPNLSSLNSADIGSVCLKIKQDTVFDNESNSECLKQELFSDQIIEISDDGSWEMKETVDTSILTHVDESLNIDPFTGQPIMACANSKTSFIESPQLPVVKTIKQPEAYFENKKSNLGCSVIFEDKEDVYSAACVTTFSGASSLSSTVTESIVEQDLESHQSPKDIESTTCDYSLASKENNVVDCDSPIKCNSKSVTPHVKEAAPHLPTPSVNIGAAIMEEYEKDLQRKKEHLNLPEVSLLEFGDSVKDLEIQRRDVIQQMTVKAKRKDSWIRTFRPNLTNNASDSRDIRSEEEQVVSDLDQTQISVSTKIRPFGEENSRIIRQDQTNHVSKTEAADIAGELQIKNHDSKSDKLIDIDKLIANAMLPIFGDTIKVTMGKQNDSENAVELMNKKNKINIADNFEGEFLGKCLKNNSRKLPENAKIAGEVDDRSILEKKAETRSYWESKMLAAVDDGGWEPVANVLFQSEPVTNTDDVSGNSVPPPPEFSADIDLPNEGSLSSAEDSLDDFTLNEKECVRPTKQYMFGADQEIQAKIETCHIETRSKKPSSQENVIEAEIRAQQLREETLRRETDIRSRDKTGGASSPSSHTSDEGFVDRSPEEIPSPPSPSSSHGGYTHTLRGLNGEPIIYDAVSPPSQFFTEKNSANEGDSETKIALEIRELKEREAELRAIREMREKEQALKAVKGSNVLRQEIDLDEFVDENGSSKDLLEDHLISLTTTTDEGNFSEYGETNSSEDKSSDGSNSRIMSPDFQSYGSHADIRQRKPGTVKPFEDEDNDEQPVYTRMKKESVIEREIRLAREREEAYRREKGLLPIDAPSKTVKQKSNLNTVITNGHTTPAEEEFTVQRELPSLQETIVDQPPKRGVQHRIATNRIQQEIEETAQRERELKNTGQIRTLSEETVDSKVTRLADLAIEQNNLIKEKASRLSSTTSSLSSSSVAAPSPLINNTLSNYKRTPSPGCPATSFTQSTFSNSSFSSSSKLTRSLSTNNLSVGCGGSGGSSNTLRAPQKGLMEKFFASRGKLTGTAFLPQGSSTATLPLPAKTSSPSFTTNGVHTRPMKVMPKAAVIRRDVHSKEEVEAPKIYRRTHTTAEEKIQEELREMKQRESELRRLRSRTLGRSHPNLAGLGDTEDDDEFSATEGVDSSPLLHEVNGELRSASSVSNLLEKENEPIQQGPVPDKIIRRRSALIAQWEGRIQQTADT